MVNLLLNYQHDIFLLTIYGGSTNLGFHLRGSCISPGPIKSNFSGGHAMKEIARKSIPVPSAAVSPAIASMHPSYRSAAVQASAALHNLTMQFRLKNKKRPLKTGRA